MVLGKNQNIVDMYDKLHGVDVSDISEGLLRDAKAGFSDLQIGKMFGYKRNKCQKIEAKTWY